MKEKAHRLSVNLMTIETSFGLTWPWPWAAKWSRFTNSKMKANIMTSTPLLIFFVSREAMDKNSVILSAAREVIFSLDFISSWSSEDDGGEEELNRRYRNMNVWIFLLGRCQVAGGSAVSSCEMKARSSPTRARCEGQFAKYFSSKREVTQGVSSSVWPWKGIHLRSGVKSFCEVRNRAGHVGGVTLSSVHLFLLCCHFYEPANLKATF